MKKIILVSALMAFSYLSIGCDICGCSISNFNPFLFPHLSKNYISLNYLHRVYDIHPGTETAAEQRYNSLLFSGQVSISKRIQLNASLPYQFKRLSTAEGATRLSGIGDANLSANYRVWEKMTKAARQSILIGAGVKLPTGRYRSTESKEINDQNFQLGTGSMDYMLNASYRLGFRKWMLSAAGSYKYNTQNKNDYRYGDVLSYGATAVYRKDWKKISLLPYLQGLREVQMKDADQHILQSHSGGHVLYAGAGVDVNTKKIAVGLNYQKGISQDLAKGDIKVKPRLNLHLSFIL